MAKLSAWVKKHLRHDPKSPKCHKDQLPFLPTPRRPITPTSFYTATNPFFKLPYDIRALILSIAFGRTFHIELSLQEQKWQWRGAICSRDQDGWPCKGYPRAELWNDGCLKSAYSKSKNSDYYRPGIMGFLLSCKQAYAEGIHLLYANSSIFIASQPLLLHLGRLIPAVRLASITSLEVLLSVHDNPNGQQEPSFTLNNLAPILSNIKTACPNLVSFALSFYLHSHAEHLLTGPTIPSLDAFYNSTQLRDMRIEVPHVTWREMRHAMEGYQQHPYEQTAQSGTRMRALWRALDGGEATVQERATERYPGPPLRLLREGEGDVGGESRGYWVILGDCGPFDYRVAQCERGTV